MSNCNTNDTPNTFVGDPRTAIEIKGGNKIRVELEKTQTKDIYTVHYQEFVAPAINVSYKGPALMVGTLLASAVIDGSIIEGSNPIVERTMIPDKGLSLTGPISYTETNILGTEYGLWPRFDGSPTLITVKDATGYVTSKQVGVEYRYPFYMLYSAKDSITQEDLSSATEDLLISIYDKYNSFVYNYTAMPVYIYWLFPVITPTFSAAQEGAQNVPLKLDIPALLLTIAGVPTPITYRVIRTAVKTKFSTTTPITIHP